MSFERRPVTPFSKIVHDTIPDEPGPRTGFIKPNLHPLDHADHADQRCELPTVTVGEGLPDKFKSWQVKDYSQGARLESSPYKRERAVGNLGYTKEHPTTKVAAEGLECYKVMWRPDGNPLDGASSPDLHMSGVVTYSGYKGFRPGEICDPYVEGKVNVPDRRAVAPWQGQPKDKSMATRIAQRRLNRGSK